MDRDQKDKFEKLRAEQSGNEGLYLEFEDKEWPLTYTDHDRQIARAIVIDDEENYYFVRMDRSDAFGAVTLVETSGGGVEEGESPEAAIRRELKEELGAEVEILCKLGLVSDYYNLVHRHNLNHYFLCRVKSFGETKLTRDEEEEFHLKKIKLRYEEAVEAYEAGLNSRLGRLLAQRELPVLRRAKELLG